MTEVILQTQKCDETGETGLIVAGVQVQDQMVVASGDMAGVLIAHDLIEHLHGPAGIGGSAEELIAMGATWYVRGRHGDISRGKYAGFHPSEHDIASDVGNQCFEAWIRQDRCWDIEPWQMATERGAGMIDDALPFIFAEAVKNMRGNVADYHQGDVFNFLLGARRFMRHGYAVMNNRYHHAPMTPNAAFWAIADAVDGYLKYAELWEGQQATLIYDIGAGTATVADVDEDYDESEWD